MLTIGDNRILQNFRAWPKRAQGNIVDCLSLVSYQVKVFDGMLIM